MAYEKVFTNPYPNGWEDLPSEATPITASALQEHTDAIEHIEDYLENNPGGGASTWSEVAEKPFESIGNNLSVDENGRLNAIGGGGGSDDNYGTKADFEAVKDSLPIGSAFDILDDGEGGGGSSEIYDDTERVIGTWFGKNLYRKTFVKNNIGIPTSATGYEFGIPHDLRIAFGFASIYNTSSKQTALLSMQIAHNDGSSELRFKSVDSWSANTAIYVYVTLFYFKD